MPLSSVTAAVMYQLVVRKRPCAPSTTGQLFVGRYELRVKARRSAIIQDHRAAAL